MKNLRKLLIDDKEILVVDFSDLNEDEMMNLVSASRALLLEERRPQRLLVILNGNNFVTTKVMRHIENDQRDAIAFSVKQAVVGLSKPQRMILKGYNVMFKRDVKTFDSQDQAIKYLTD